MTCDMCRLCRETSVADVLNQHTAGGTAGGTRFLCRSQYVAGLDPECPCHLRATTAHLAHAGQAIAAPLSKLADGG